jgi:hypothetical protein
LRLAAITVSTGSQLIAAALAGRIRHLHGSRADLQVVPVYATSNARPGANASLEVSRPTATMEVHH